MKITLVDNKQTETKDVDRLHIILRNGMELSIWDSDDEFVINCWDAITIIPKATNSIVIRSLYGKKND
jgi:hypothetical protein